MFQQEDAAKSGHSLPIPRPQPPSTTMTHAPPVLTSVTPSWFRERPAPQPHNFFDLDVALCVWRHPSCATHDSPLFTPGSPLLIYAPPHDSPLTVHTPGSFRPAQAFLGIANPCANSDRADGKQCISVTHCPTTALFPSLSLPLSIPPPLGPALTAVPIPLPS